MGKRELVIIVAFVLAGAVVYHLTAPAPKEGERGFSLTRMFSNIKRDIGANHSSASLTKTGTLPIGAGVSELRLSAGRSVPLIVTGERRDDVAYEMWVESTGPDEPTARDYAGRTSLVQDDLGVAQAVVLRFPSEGVQTARLALRVPQRLVVRIETAGRVTVSDVRGVDLRNLAAETTLTNVIGTVTGSHRASDLTITKAGAVTLTLTSSRTRLREIAGPITLNARNGECVIANSTGAVDATMTNVELALTDHGGPIRLGGENGELRMTRPSAGLVVDVRRMLVELALSTAVPATIITTDEALRVTLTGPPPMTIDALATDGGTVRAADFDLTPTRQERESRLAAPLAGGGPRMVLRNARADIVITRGK